ncbi:MAG: hypothetical protein KF878_35655 [Planctomycetes bacterium]|nr:hypothetical protein [Planctomycetota bacterium]
MGDDRSMIDELRKLVRERRRYPLEAYLFLYQALDMAQRLVGEKRHVSGPELLEGVRKLAVEQFGPLALMVFQHWGIRRTQDVGEMVFNLVDRELMGKTDQDKREDFDAVFDIEEVFAPQRLMAEQDPKQLIPPYRVSARDLPSAARASNAP